MIRVFKAQLHGEEEGGGAIIAEGIDPQRSPKFTRLLNERFGSRYEC